jgi:hypothetical protein
MKLEFGNPEHIALTKKYKSGKVWADVVGYFPIKDIFTCKDCLFCEGHEYHNKVYYKCNKHPITSGPGTDIRLKDPSCILFRKELPKNKIKTIPIQLTSDTAIEEFERMQDREEKF